MASPPRACWTRVWLLRLNRPEMQRAAATSLLAVDWSHPVLRVASLPLVVGDVPDPVHHLGDRLVYGAAGIVVRRIQGSSRDVVHARGPIRGGLVAGHEGLGRLRVGLVHVVGDGLDRTPDVQRVANLDVDA